MGATPPAPIKFYASDSIRSIVCANCTPLFLNTGVAFHPAPYATCCDVCGAKAR